MTGVERDAALELARDVLWLELRSTTRFVLLVLAVESTRAHVARLSLRECAHRTRLSEGTVVRALRELERDGWLTRIAVHDSTLGQQSNRYQVNDGRVRSQAATARAAERKRIEGHE